MVGDSGLTVRRFRRIGLTAAVPMLLTVVVLVLWPATNIVIQYFNWDRFASIFGDERIQRVLWTSVVQATLSTALAVIVGVPLAALFAKHHFPGKRLASAVVTVPFVLPSVVVAIAALSLSGGERPLLTIVVAHAFFNVAVVVRIVRPTVTSNTTLDHAATTLGAGALKRLIQVDVPLARHSIQNAAVVTFIFCFTSYGVVRIIGGLSTTTTEVEIYTRAIQLGDMSTAVALAIVQTIFLAIVTLVFRPSADALQVKPTAAIAIRRLRPLGVTGIWAACGLFLVPIAVIVLKSLRSNGKWTTLGWEQIDPGIVLRSLTFAAIASALSLLLAGLLTVATTHSGRSSRLMSAIASAPIAVSAIVLGIGIVATFNSGWLDIRGSMWLIPTMHAIVATPITFRILRASLEVITSDHRAAAATLGASPLRTIMTVDFGAFRTSAFYAGVVSGCVSLGEFGATSVLARDSSRTIPIEISRLLGKPGDLNQLHGYALATLLLLIIAMAIFSTGKSNA